MSSEQKKGRPKFLYSRIEPSNVEPALIRFLLKRHIAKTENQADFLVISLFILCIVSSILLVVHGQDTSTVYISKESVLKALSLQ